MKIIKKNQLVILLMSLILITAGYLNFNANNNNKVQTRAEVGDAMLVSANPSKENINETINEDKDDNSQMENKQEQNAESIDTIAEDQYFVKSKLERDTMYSQMLETYQEIYNNTNSTAEQKNEAMKEISKISNTRNSIMIAENLITAKGFEDLVIFVNSNSTSVIVKAQELTLEQIAQIQNIVSRELNIDIQMIHISTK